MKTLFDMYLTANAFADKIYQDKFGEEGVRSAEEDLAFKIELMEKLNARDDLVDYFGVVFLMLEGMLERDLQYEKFDSEDDRLMAIMHLFNSPPYDFLISWIPQKQQLDMAVKGVSQLAGLIRAEAH